MTTKTSEQTLLVSVESRTAWITLNRPEKRNAMNDTTLIALIATLRSTIADDKVRSIVLTGAGDCFSAGRDLKNLKHLKQPGADGPASVRLEDESLSSTVDLLADAVRVLLASPKPTIAAVRGFAFGGGQTLSLASDFIVAESDARFANVEIANGYPAALNTVLLRRHLGPRMALEIALTGTPRTAVEYRELGLVNRVCEPGALHFRDAWSSLLSLMIGHRGQCVARKRLCAHARKRQSQLASSLRTSSTSCYDWTMLSARPNPHFKLVTRYKTDEWAQPASRRYSSPAGSSV